MLNVHREGSQSSSTGNPNQNKLSLMRPIIHPHYRNTGTHMPCIMYLIISISLQLCLYFIECSLHDSAHLDAGNMKRLRQHPCLHVFYSLLEETVSTRYLIQC